MMLPCLFVLLGSGLAAQTSPPVEKVSALHESATPTPAPNPPSLTPETRGDIFMARKMYREAIESYREAITSNAVLENKIGIAYHQMLELDKAKRQYERAIKINAQYSEAINNLGTIYYAKKNFRKAANLYKKALKVAPNSASIHSNLGTALFARKKYKDAFAEYQVALAIDPEVFEHRNSHGVLLQERSVQERAKFHFYLAKLYAKSGNVERTLIYMRKAIEEGFKERDKFKSDPEFAALQQLPEFQQLLVLEPRVL